MLEFQQSEQTAERRNWIIVLVDSADGVTGKTGQTGKVYISKNGSTGVLSTNSIVEVDSTNMPGHYYIQLTQSELDTLGFVSITMKTSATLAFHDRAIVSYNNPYVTQGGFTAASVPSTGGISKTQAKALLTDIRKVVREEIEAVETAEDDSETTEDNKENEILNKILEAVTAEKPLEEPEEADYSEILGAINNIPGPKDYTQELKSLSNQIKVLTDTYSVDISLFSKAVMEFQSKMQLATKDIDSSLKEVASIKKGFTDLQALMDQFNTTLKEQSDMDKRFDAMSSSANNQKLAELTSQIKQLMVNIVNMKYDILKQLTVAEK